MHNNSYSKFGDDFPIAGLSVKQFIELCVSLGFGNRPNSYPNKPKSPPPEIMGIDDVIKLRAIPRPRSISSHINGSSHFIGPPTGDGAWCSSDKKSKTG